MAPYTPPVAQGGAAVAQLIPTPRPAMRHIRLSCKIDCKAQKNTLGVFFGFCGPVKGPEGYFSDFSDAIKPPDGNPYGYGLRPSRG